MVWLIKLGKYLPFLYTMLKALAKLLPNKSKYQKKIEDFMREAGEFLPETPQLPPKEARKERAKEIMKTALALVDELGYTVDTGEVNGLQGDMNGFIVNNIEMMSNHKLSNLVKITRRCVDLNIETVKTLSVCGLPDKPVKEIAIKEKPLEDVPNESDVRNEDVIRILS